MDYAYLLTLLKFDLQKRNRSEDEYLVNLLKVSENSLTEKGLDLSDDIKSQNLVVWYAAYLYRKRAAGTDSAMPRFLQLEIHDFKLSHPRKERDENAV